MRARRVKVRDLIFAGSGRNPIVDAVIARWSLRMPPERPEIESTENVC